jgi:endonuclease YncB( thermonuclease family)
MDFAGRILRVIDGDTVWIRVRVRTLQSAPPLSTAPGVDAQRRLKHRLPRGAHVTIASHMVDRYGRVVGTIHLNEGPGDAFVKEKATPS